MEAELWRMSHLAEVSNAGIAGWGVSANAAPELDYSGILRVLKTPTNKFLFMNGLPGQVRSCRAVFGVVQGFLRGAWEGVLVRERFIHWQPLAQEVKEADMERRLR